MRGVHTHTRTHTHTHTHTLLYVVSGSKRIVTIFVTTCTLFQFKDQSLTGSYFSEFGYYLSSTLPSDLVCRLDIVIRGALSDVPVRVKVTVS